MKIVDPTEYDSWDAKVWALHGATFFHGAGWACVLKRAYGYCPRYVVIEENGRLAAVVPLMEVKSFLTGMRAVSLPFTDYCEPLVPHVEVSKVMLDAVIEEGRRQGWKYVELRGGSDYLGDGAASAWFYRHTLDLTAGTERLFRNLRDSTRRNIKKAEREGVVVCFETSLEAVREFYRLNCLTRREHGLPPQPWCFFELLHGEVLARGMGAVALATREGTAVAANVYLYANGEVIYKYGASDKAWQHLRASNLVMWEAIKRWVDLGFRSLCFGRTEPGNGGLRQFKTGWGAEESTLNYYRYDLARNAFVQGDKGIPNTANQVFSRMPLPALKAVGNLLYRHMG